MKKPIIRVCGVFIICPLICLPRAGSGLSAMSQEQSTAPLAKDQSASEQDIPEEEVTQAGQVMIDGRQVLTVYEPIAQLTPEARAHGIKERIIALARETSIPPESVRVQPRDAWTDILADNNVIMAVTDADARAVGKNRQLLALENAESIRQ